MTTEPKGWRVQFRRYPLYAVELEKVDVIECIKAFEAGAQNVYFVDGDGRYSGIAMPKKRFSYGWSRQAAMTVPCPEIQDKSLGGGVHLLPGKRKRLKSSAPFPNATKYR